MTEFVITRAAEFDDAPFAAVAIALGEVEWTPALERTIRVCRAFDPIYFEEAFVRGLNIGWAEQSKKLAGAA